MIKKILVIALLFISLPCMAYENYILLSDHEISDVKISNEEIITVEPIVTIKSEKKSMMIIPHKVGSTRLSFCKGKRHINLVVKVLENRTCIKRVNGVKLIPIDLPPELQ